MTNSINWPITVRSAVPFRSGNYIFPFYHVGQLFLIFQSVSMIGLNDKRGVLVAYIDYAKA